MNMAASCQSQPKYFYSSMCCSLSFKENDFAIHNIITHPISTPYHGKPFVLEL